MATTLFLCAGLTVVLIAAFCTHLPLPYPYGHVNIEQYPDEYINIVNDIKIPSAAAVRSYAQNHGAVVRLLHSGNVIKLFESAVIGTESVAVSTSGDVTKLTMIDRYGILKQALKTSETGEYSLIESAINIGPGRPLGSRHTDEDTVVVCDSLKGLLEIDLSARPSDSGGGDRVKILTNSVVSLNHPVDQSSTLLYLNDLDISADRRTVYFSSSTNRGVVSYDSERGFYDTMRSFLLTWLAGDISGRLLSYNYDTKVTAVLMDDLFYANGVALADDESYVLVVETVGLRVMKYYLKGPWKGGSEVFIDNLPGFPDGIMRSSDGNSFLISLVAPLSPLILLTKSRISRWIMSWALLGPVKGLFTPLIKQFGCVMRVAAATADVSEVYLDENGDVVSTISAAVEDSTGKIYFGNLGGSFVSYYDREML